MPEEKMREKLVVVTTLAIVWGCTGSSDKIASDAKGDAAIPAEITEETVLADSGGGEPDVPVLPEVWPDLTFDIPGETTGECEPGTGCFGDTCKGNQECLSGWCMEHQGEGVCSMECQEECPQGWQCKAIGGTEPDLVYACVSAFANLCKPCASNADCKSPGGVEDVCVDYGEEGAFCGGGCEISEDCPAGFSCVEGMTTQGIAITQCIADSGQCPCTGKSQTLKLWTPCALQNDYGICAGKRICQDDGLSPCDAEIPAADVCNGLDDDCDGQTDEDTCDDGNPCTGDSCPGEEGCQNTPITGGPCEDGDVCTMADHCDSGECTGTPVLCDDGNLCTDDYCDESGGCQFDFNQADCNDSDPCTVADECTDGKCLGVSVNCECQTDADCLAFEDGDLCTGVLFCDDEKPPYQCKTQPGTPVTCPEPEGTDAPCLKAVCNPDDAQCSFEPHHEGLACEDGNACTLGDKCLAGSCTPGIDANCNDGNPCTDDSCNPQSGCTNLPNQEPCNDGDMCTSGDVCTNGQCLPGTVVDCNDGNPCTDDSCSPEAGCVNLSNQESCSDNNACTTGDTCSGGQCLPTGMLDCNDANLCTDDSCTPQGGCLNDPNQNPCNDNNACTAGDVCSGGQCQPGDQVVCDDKNPCTADSCLQDSGCLFAADDQLQCSDANECTVADACVNGICVPGQLEDCDDSDLCTTDWCDPAQGCMHKLNAAPCDDGDVCTSGDHCELGDCIAGNQLVCNDNNPCTDDSCAPLAGCQFVPNQATCNDGSECTTVDICTGGQCKGTQPPDCGDDDPCTDTWCDPDQGCVTSLNQAPCDDQDKCTTVDICDNGACLGSTPLDCDDENVCTQDLCDPDTGCYALPQPGQCDDGESCTVNDLCADGECGGTPCEDEGMICGADGCQACSSLLFDGVDDYLEANTTWGQVTDGTGHVTFETWFKLTDDAPLHAGLVTVSCGLYAIRFAQNNRLALVRWPDAPCVGPTSVTKGQWHHVAGVADVGAGGTFILYLDGKEECSSVATQPISNWVDAHKEEVFMGTSTGGGCISEGKVPVPTQFLPGQMGAVRVSSEAAYSEAFVPEKSAPVTDDTVFLYPLTEGQGEVAVDASPNGHDGTISGGLWVQDSPLEGCCQPECNNKQCGNDGCGGSCGTCGGGESCVSGLCTNQCFSDDFNDSNVSDWSVLEGSWGFTTGKDGTVAWGYNGGNYKSGRATHALLKGLQWFSIEMDFRVDWGMAGDFNLYMSEVGTSDSYDLGLFPAGSDSSPDRVYKVVGGVGTQVASHGCSVGAGQWNTMKFVREPGGKLEVLKNGSLYFSGTDTDITGALDVVIRFHGNGFVDNVKVICLGD